MDKFNTDSVIGVDMGGTKIGAGLVSHNQVLKHAFKSIDGNAAKEIVLSDLILCIDELMDDEVKGIGVGVPSLVDVKTGTVLNVQNIPSWDEVPVGDILHQRYGVPIYVNNDANCFAVGEKYFGEGKPYDHFIGITLGTGVGGGVFLNQQLYEGVNCCAGEFGSISYLDSIYEDYCSGKFFREKIGVDGKIVSERAMQGDKEALRAFSDYGEHLGHLIQTILFAYDAEAIIIGGSIRKDYDFFEASMRSVLEEFPYGHCIEKLNIHVSKLKDSPVLGAAALYWDAMVKAESSLFLGTK